MKKIFAAIGIPVGLLLAGCEVPLQDKTEERLLDQPVGSYELFKYADNGDFLLVVKENETKMENVITAKGERGSSVCATFKVVNVRSDKTGKLMTSYVFENHVPVPDLTPENLLSFEPHQGVVDQKCRSTPAPIIG